MKLTKKSIELLGHMHDLAFQITGNVKMPVSSKNILDISKFKRNEYAICLRELKKYRLIKMHIRIVEYIDPKKKSFPMYSVTDKGVKFFEEELPRRENENINTEINIKALTISKLALVISILSILGVIIDKILRVLGLF